MQARGDRPLAAEVPGTAGETGDPSGRAGGLGDGPGMVPSRSAMAATARRMVSKVPEVIIWFWVIKILCTTVGETFADWIDMELGVGLVMTALLFTGVMAVVLAVGARL